MVTAQQSEVYPTVLPSETPMITTAQQSEVYSTVLPAEPPMITTADHWSCATKDIASYFLPPTPTGALSTARLSYGRSVQPCTYTGVEAFDCPFPDKSLWCGFSTAVPSTLKDEYAAYGSTASSRWAERSSAAVSLAIACPHSWWQAKDRVSFGAENLNFTIIEAECYTEAHATGGEPFVYSITTTILAPTPAPTTPPQTSQV